jgi:deazaflavin-dependent oxidoreductase (nitroreductase family)
VSRYLKPALPLRLVNRIVVAFGLMPIVLTRGRPGGQWRSVPVNVLEVTGERYLVAVRGHSHWTRNLLANPEGQLRVKGRTTQFVAVPIDEATKPRLIEEYLRRWGQAKSLFQQLPDPADHPVFRIAPAK